MRGRGWGAAALLPFVAAACIDYLAIDGVGNQESVPVLLGLLTAGEDSVFVALGRSGPGTATGPEPGASLALTTPAGVFPLVEVDPEGLACGVPDGFSCYVAELPIPLAPGDSARVRGTLIGGTEVVAATQLPPAPPVRLAGHPPGDTVRYVDRSDQEPVLEVASGGDWVSLRDTAFAVTWWRDGEQGVCPSPIYFLAGWNLRVPLFSGPPAVTLNDPRCDGLPLTDWDSLAAPVVFLGFDAHASRWYEQTGELWRSEGDRWGVEGAFGFLGSATPAAFVLHLTARPTSP